MALKLPVQAGCFVKPFYNCPGSDIRCELSKAATVNIFCLLLISREAHLDPAPLSVTVAVSFIDAFYLVEKASAYL